MGVRGAAAAHLQDVCDAEYLCAPLVKVNDPAYKFPSCEVGGVAALACIGQPSCPGACVPSCIVPEGQRGLLVKTNTCQTGELCAPCSSGACD